MPQISKLRELNHTESFIQIDFTKGYLYVDRAGEVLNFFADDEKPLSYSMDVNRLLIQSPKAGIGQLRISTHDFWCHFANPGKFTENKTLNTAEKYHDLAKQLLSITKPGPIKRVGWRAYMLYEFSHRVENLGSIVKTRSGKSLAALVQLDLPQDVRVNVQLKLLERKDGGNQSALLFDIDTSYEGDMTLPQVREKLELVRSSFFARQVTDHINEVLKGC